ncbi:MAG: GntR family transcriptional regulator [Planctomycetes bacterium]|nr:GntR family transcriptional regulator [Planctomycetota bacterium]
MNESPELVLDGGAPVWQQIEGQIRQFILSGALRPGEELPTVRAVAVGLAVNPHAVEQAYDRLERADLVTWAGGSGPRVAVPSGGPGGADLKKLCELFLRQAAQRGYSLAAVVHALQACLKEEVSS